MGRATIRGSDESIAAILMDGADAANAGRQPDWMELIAVEGEVEHLRDAGKLDAAARRSLMARARAAVPPNRPDVLETTVELIRA